MNVLKQEVEELNKYRTQQMNLQALENQIQLKRDLYRTSIQRQQIAKNYLKETTQALSKTQIG